MGGIMAYALGKNTKAVVDIVLALVGGLLANLAANASSFGQYAPYVTIGGVVGGYAVSDVLSYVDTGALPSTPVIIGQAQASFNAAKPLIQTEIAKLSQNDQALANAAIAVIDGYLAKTPTS